jgi:hypothetical protein
MVGLTERELGLGAVSGGLVARARAGFGARAGPGQGHGRGGGVVGRSADGQGYV